MPSKDPEKRREAHRRYEEKRRKANGERHKCWTLIFYPDSAPAEWKDLISDLHLRVWVSPVHDSDVWTAADEKKDAQHKAGTGKKPHFHLICEYEVQVDRDTFLGDFAFLNGPASVKNVKSLSAMVRYLIHADDPDKAQYDVADMRVFGGASTDVVMQLGTGERHMVLKAMRRFIREHRIVDFCDFVDYCDDCESTWASLLDDNSSYVIEKYIKSMRYKIQEEQREFERRYGMPGSHTVLPKDRVEQRVNTDAAGSVCQGTYADPHGIGQPLTNEIEKQG